MLGDRKWKKTAIWVIAILAVAGLIASSFRTQPMPVETAAAKKGPMRVTVDGEGKTRVRERYQLLAPVSGRMGRIDLHVGDRVEVGNNITTIESMDAPLLDVRTRLEGEARVRTGQAALDRALSSIELARTAAQHAEREFERRKELVAKGAAARAELDAAEMDRDRARRELETAKLASETERNAMEQAKVSLGVPTGRGVGRVQVRAPVAGTILKVLRESAGVISAGMPIVEIGDISQLELVVDLLSTDAVRIQPGFEGQLDQWGGGVALPLVVRRVEPTAFTKVSALGVEEQRVNVILDFVPVADLKAPPLGDGYQGTARIAVWKSEAVVKVPLGALFRDGDKWSLYVADGTFARRRSVEVGHRDGLDAEVLSGLKEGEKVILHPGDKLKDGTLITP